MNLIRLQDEEPINENFQCDGSVTAALEVFVCINHFTAGSAKPTHQSVFVPERYSLGVMPSYLRKARIIGLVS